MKIEYGTTTQIPIVLDRGHYATQEIENTEGFVDALVYGNFIVQSGAVGVGIDIYAYGSLTGVNYTGFGGVSGIVPSSGYFDNFGIATPKLIRGWVNTDGQHMRLGPISVARAFGGILPQKWGLKIYQEKFGASNSSYFTSGEIYYQNITFSDTF